MSTRTQTTTTSFHTSVTEALRWVAEETNGIAVETAVEVSVLPAETIRGGGGPIAYTYRAEITTTVYR